MNQLIVVSTLKEIQPFLNSFNVSQKSSTSGFIKLSDELELLISGIGSPSTIFTLTKLLSARQYGRIVQVGIAGSYKHDIPLGSIVEVGQDCFADLGIDDNGSFVQLFNTGLSSANEKPFKNGLLVNPGQKNTGFPNVRSITVNTASGSNELIQQRKSYFNPDIESMEGAAAFFVCMQMGIPIMQMRSISNMVEPRNKKAWEMDIAIKNLNNWLMDFVNVGESN